MTRAARAALLLLAACAHAPAERQAPPPADRAAAEAAACAKGTLPAWLDDDALAAAERRDRWGAFGVDFDESFRDSSAYVPDSRPPHRPSGEGTSSAAQLLAERRAFQARCAWSRAGAAAARP